MLSRRVLILGFLSTLSASAGSLFTHQGNSTPAKAMSAGTNNIPAPEFTYDGGNTTSFTPNSAGQLIRSEYRQSSRATPTYSYGVNGPCRT